MSNINKCAEDFKENRQKYNGLKEVKSILAKAHGRGYNITEELFNLESISGGDLFDFDWDFNFDNSKHTTKVNKKTKSNTRIIFL